MRCVFIIQPCGHTLQLDNLTLLTAHSWLIYKIPNTVCICHYQSSYELVIFGHNCFIYQFQIILLCVHVQVSRINWSLTDKSLHELGLHKRRFITRCLFSYHLMFLCVLIFVSVCFFLSRF